jgi:cytochrome c oxidase subunit 2
MRWIILIVLVLFLLLAGCFPELPDDESFEVEDYMQEVEAVEKELREQEEPEMEVEQDAPMKIFSVRVFQFAFEPDVIEVDYGDNVMIAVTSMDVAHGFALPDFGVNERVPPEETIEIRFVADRKGEFDFFNSVYSGKGWKNMTGKFIVR